LVPDFQFGEDYIVMKEFSAEHLFAAFASEFAWSDHSNLFSLREIPG